MNMIYLLLIIIFILCLDMFSTIIFNKIDRYFFRKTKDRIEKKNKKEDKE